MSRRVDRTREERQRRAEIRNEIQRAVAGIESGGGGGVSETRVREIIDEEIVDGQAIDAAIDTLIAAETHLSQANVEAIITAELAAGQSIDNAIDALISAHLAAEGHIDTADVTAEITAECLDTGIIDNRIDTLIAAQTHLETADVENVITAEIAPGQSIDNAIDNLVLAHFLSEWHQSETDIQALITTEVGAAGIIDNAIDALIATHLAGDPHPTTTDIENIIDFEISAGQSIDQAIINGVGDHFADKPHLRARASVYVEMGDTQQTLTSTPTPIVLNGNFSTLDTNYASSFTIGDSGVLGGTGDAIEFNDNDSLGSVTFDVWYTLNGKHTADDGRPMEFRALPYVDGALNSRGVINGITGVADGSTISATKVARITLDDTEKFTLRAEYLNSLAGDGGFLQVAGAYSYSGSTNITATAAAVAFDTGEVTDSNITLNGDGSLTLAVGGIYQVSVNLPVNDDGSAGGVRSRVFAYCESDPAGGTSYSALNNLRGQDYARETSGGQGVNFAGIIDAAAGERVRVMIDQSGTTDISTETGEASINIVRIPVAEDGSESGALAPYGCTIIMKEV